MVRDFKNEFKKNGNVHVEFRHDGKLRRIVFEKDSQALWDYMDLYDKWGEKEFNSQNNFLDITDEIVMGFINKLRDRYHFIVNENNSSLFYPILHPTKKCIDIMSIKQIH